MRVGLVAVALLLLAALANRPAMGPALAGPVQREAAAAQLQVVAPAIAEKGTAKPVMTRPNDASKMKRQKLSVRRGNGTNTEQMLSV